MRKIMFGAERTIQFDPVRPFDPTWSPRNSAGARGRVALRRPWVQYADGPALATDQPPRLWRGVVVALALVMPFWCAVGLALDWAIRP